MNTVRLIQKVGQVSLSTLVENAATRGFELVGSPTLVSNVPVQLMIHTGVQASKPEYMIIETFGQDRLPERISEFLDKGWRIYGSLITGEVPMQAMVRGDIGVHKMFGMSQNDPVDTGDWTDKINKAKDDAVKECKEYSDTTVDTLAQTMHLNGTALSDNLAELTVEFEKEKQTHRDGIFLQASKNTRYDRDISDLDMKLQMEAEERRTDVSRLEDMIIAALGERAIVAEPEPVAARSVEPVEYPPIIPEGSVWK